MKGTRHIVYLVCCDESEPIPCGNSDPYPTTPLPHVPSPHQLCPQAALATRVWVVSQWD